MKHYALILFVVLCLALSSSLSPSWASVRKLPSFNLYTLRGEEIPFHPAETAVLFFLSPECFSCLSSLLDLVKDLESLGKNMPLYPVCLRCDFRAARDLEESLGGRLTIYLANPELQALLGVWETPAVFLVSRERRVLYQEKGKVSWEALRLSLPSEVKSRSVREGQTTCTLDLCS